jgi:hypothetical protein
MVQARSVKSPLAAQNRFLSLKGQVLLAKYKNIEKIGGIMSKTYRLIPNVTCPPCQ